MLPTKPDDPAWEDARRRYEEKIQDVELAVYNLLEAYEILPSQDELQFNALATAIGMASVAPGTEMLVPPSLQRLSYALAGIGLLHMAEMDIRKQMEKE